MGEGWGKGGGRGAKLANPEYIILKIKPLEAAKQGSRRCVGSVVKRPALHPPPPDGHLARVKATMAWHGCSPATLVF